MKIRFVYNKKMHCRELVVRSQKNEELNPRQAKWICDGSNEVFLATSYELTSETGRCVITYDISGLMSLKTYLKKYALSGTTFASMLVDLARAYGSCTNGRDRRFWQQSLLFDSRYVFVDDSGHLWFVFIPLDGLPFSLDNSPLQLLRLLGDVRRVRFQTPNDITLAQSLSAYVLNERDTFSFNAFRGFLQRECNVSIGSDGKAVAKETDYEGLRQADMKSSLHKRGFTGSHRVSMRDLLLGKSSSTANNQQIDEAWLPKSYVIRRLATGESFIFTENQELILGRGSACYPRLLGNSTVSRRHTAIIVSRTVATVRDLGSTNGTLVDGRRIRPNESVVTQLSQRISLGTEEIVIESYNGH